jgi:putative salt-induced outer membrane protein
MFQKLLVKILCITAIGCLAVMRGPCFADLSVGKVPKRFSNKTRFSMVDTGGNTDTLTLAGENRMTYRLSDKWEGAWGVGIVHQETGSTTESERYFTDLRLDAALGDKPYAYLLGSWERDIFSGFDHRIGLGPGIGCKFLKGPHHFLSAEYGWNYRYEAYSEKEEAPEEFLEGRLYAKYEWAFTEETSFSQTLEYLQSYEEGDTYKLKADSAVVIVLNSITALEITYGLRYNNHPVPKTLETIDTTFATSLLIKL